MATVATHAPAVKSPRKSKTPRSLQLLEAPSPCFDLWGAVRITEGRKVDTYLFRQIEADFGEGWEVEKLTSDLATAEHYHVHLAGKETSCTCPGHTYHGYCRHCEALLALDAAGKLPRFLPKQKHGACNRCQEATDAPGLCVECSEEDEYHSACQQEAEMREAGLDPWSEWDASAFADDTFCPADADF